MIVDIANLSVIYMSYDEPKAEYTWSIINSMLPWAKRVHGITGIDNAHKAAALASETERFILIDGDNIPDWNFFNKSLTLNDSNMDNVFRWKARNIINDLTYGNGGLSCWTKTFIHNMKTHEQSSSIKSQIEFCWETGYTAMHDCWSTTYPNGSPEQAFRAGFREGVKLLLVQGIMPDIDDINTTVYKPNLDKLKIWMTVGRDVENGEYAMLGARLGTIHALNSADLVIINDLKFIDAIFNNITDKNASMKNSLTEINSALEWKLPELDKISSSFLKANMHQRKNKDIMLREVDFND